MIHLAFNALKDLPDFAGSSDEYSKCIQHDFPRLWGGGGGGGKATGQCNMSATGDFCLFR